MATERQESERQWPAPFFACDDDLISVSIRRPRRTTRRWQQARRFVTVLVCIALVPLFYWGIALVWGADAMFGAIGFTPITLLGLLFLAFIWERCGATD